MRRIAILAAAWVVTAEAAASGAVVERIRYVGTVSYSRVVVDLSTSARYSVLTVTGHGAGSLPERLVIDVAGAVIGPEAREPLHVGDALVQAIRTGQFDPATARIVIDLARSANYQVFTLPDPYRMVIDFRLGTEAAPEGSNQVVRADTAVESRAAEVEVPSEPVPARVRAEVDVKPGPMESEAAALPRGTGPAGARRFKVMIDPGHGGKDPGAFGIGGIIEKDVVLSVSQMLAARLKADPSIEVFLTRNDDRTLTLEERTALANAVGADLFVSVHANASPRRHTRGLEVYYLNNTNNRGTLRLAAMENGLRWDPRNSSLQQAIPDLSYILSDLRQTYKVEESRVLAEQIGRATAAHLAERYSEVLNLGAKEGPFYVLVGAYMPCVLVELSFLTNPSDAARLRTPAYREALAEGIAGGIRRYWNETRMAKNL